MAGLTVPLRAAREVALAQARTLARQGRYAEAEELLETIEHDTDPSAAVLDLMARIHAQQGHLDEADRRWAEAERLTPGNKEITEGRARIAAIRNGAGRPVALGVMARRAGASALVVLVLVLLVAIWLEDGRSQPVPAKAPVTAAASRPSPSPSDDVLAGLDLDVPGVRRQRTPGEISITFDRGLFRRQGTLSGDGRAVLDALAARLRPSASRVEVMVIGHTDDRAIRPGGDYANNLELGLIRATVVREVLHTAAGIPTARFSVSSMGGVLPPFRGGAAAAARNRTVTLRISAVGGG